MSEFIDVDRGLLAISALVGLQLTGMSCSTAAEPADELPPVCEGCDPGERVLRCRLQLTYNGLDSGFPTTRYQGTCIDEDSNPAEQEQACLDRCQEYIETLEESEMYDCDFLPVEKKFFWEGCVADDDPTGTATGVGGEGNHCPNWYAPAAHVKDYEPIGSNAASVTLDRDFVLDILSDLSSLYTCDDARYVEDTSGWVFEDIDAGDLLYRLGVRNGDEDAVVQGFDPSSMQTTTPPYSLDSVQTMLEAYDALSYADGIALTVDRLGQPANDFTIWITLQ